MGFKLNFDSSNVQTNNFETVKEGKYEATIIQAELEEFGGNYSIKFDVEIRSDVEQEHQGAKVLYNTLYLTTSNPDFAESTQKKVNAFLVACGYNGKQELDMEQVTKDIIGANVLAYVKHETKNDKTYPKVKFVGTSKFGVSQSPAANNDKGPIEVSEDDLPF